MVGLLDGASRVLAPSGSRGWFAWDAHIRYGEVDITDKDLGYGGVPPPRLKSEVMTLTQGPLARQLIQYSEGQWLTNWKKMRPELSGYLLLSMVSARHLETTTL